MGRKSFKGNIDPLAALVKGNREPEDAATMTAPAAEPIEKEEPPAGYKYNPRYIEKRSKRVQYLLTPSTVTKLKTKAEEQGRSVNDLVNEILEAALRD